MANLSLIKTLRSVNKILKGETINLILSVGRIIILKCQFLSYLPFISWISLSLTLCSNDSTSFILSSISNLSLFRYDFI